jgi:hypothetical protein
MLKKENVIKVLNKIRFELDLLDLEMPSLLKINNTTVLTEWLTSIKNTYADDLQSNRMAVAAIKDLEGLILQEVNAPQTNISIEEIQTVYFMLKSGEIEPIHLGDRHIISEIEPIYLGERHIISNTSPAFIGSEFNQKDVGVRSVSSSETYSNALGNVQVRRVIEGLISVYKPSDMQELLTLFVKPNKD